MMKLSELLQHVDTPEVARLAHLSVTGVREHSAHVRAGDLFLAMPSLSGADVEAHIRQACANGAIAVLTENSIHQGLWADNGNIPFIVIKDLRLARAKIAAYLFPHQPKHTVAITGTNGKTSSAHFFKQICECVGKKAATIGTLGVQTQDAWAKDMIQGMTCPDPFVLHECLDHLARDGTDYVALEASSHGLHQKRLDAVDFEAAAFTNLSHEHLDYHGTLQEYFDAKKRLFSQILGDGMTAVLNTDDTHSAEILRLCQQHQDRVITYGKEGKDVRLLDVAVHEHGQTLKLEFFGRMYKVELPLLGAFQIYNALCAASLACAVGLNQERVIENLARLTNVPGRLEHVGRTAKGGHVYVDYAHTPHALESVLTSLKPHVRGTLVVIFGCGGDRDRTKRYLMGEVAARHAGRVIVTDDNPRSENAGTIRASILAGCPEALEVPDRRKAIEVALKGLGDHGVCVIAGKGHEQGQLVAGEVIPFDDAAVAREILVSLKGTPL